MAATVGSRHKAACWVKLCKLACDRLSPKVSCMNSQVRAIGTNWFWLRLTATALARGPYCTGALMPSGHRPVCTAPQLQWARIKMCSVTLARSSGSSKTWRFSTTSKSVSAKWQAEQTLSLLCVMTTSTSVLWLRVEPVWPGCPPDFLPLLPRSDFGAGLVRPSVPGGLLEFLLFRLKRACSSLIDCCIAACSPVRLWT